MKTDCVQKAKNAPPSSAAPGVRTRLSARRAGQAVLWCALLCALALHPQAAMEAARTACRQWATGVMPALFPFLVLSQMLANAVGGSTMAVPAAMLAGSPAGARLLALGGGANAQRKAALCATASPLFLLGTLEGGVPMIAAHWLGAAVSYGFVCLLTPKDSDKGALPAAPPAALAKIIAGGADAMLSVCGCMVFFSVLTALAEALHPLAPPAGAALAALLEMAGGCARIASLPLAPIQRGALLCAAASFGGLSVFWQNMPYLRAAGVNICLQFAAKLVHAFAAYAIYLLLCSVFLPA